MKTVYIAGYEGKNELATSGFWWFHRVEDADDTFVRLKRDLPAKCKAIIYQGEIQVKSKTENDIDVEVEAYLEANDWENAFEKKEELV